MEENSNPAETTKIAPKPKAEELSSVKAFVSEDPQMVQDPKQDVKLLTIHRTESQAFSGPLPPPELLKAYNEIIPDGAVRILAMAEKQQDHRINLENAVVRSDIRRSDRGLIFGFIICFVIALGGIYLIATGKSISGLVLVLSQMVSIAGIFVYSNKVREKERAEKQQEKVVPSNKQDKSEKKQENPQ